MKQDALFSNRLRVIDKYEWVKYPRFWYPQMQNDGISFCVSWDSCVSCFKCPLWPRRFAGHPQCWLVFVQQVVVVVRFWSYNCNIDFLLSLSLFEIVFGFMRFRMNKISYCFDAKKKSRSSTSLVNEAKKKIIDKILRDVFSKM